MLQINVCKLRAKERQGALLKSVPMTSTAQMRREVRLLVDEARQQFGDIDLTLGDDVVPCRCSHDFVESQYGTVSTIDFFIGMMLKNIPGYRALVESEAPQRPSK